MVRGLLCNNCNAGIALFAENESRMKSAIAYLRKHKAQASRVDASAEGV